jgi:cytidylate kinase
MSKKIIIAIDGFSSCGKSTMAKALAAQLEYVFIDTGAMYRAIALFFLRNEIPFDNINAIENALKQIHLNFEYNAASQKSDVFLNGENVELLIREMQVSSKVSEVAAIGAVRDFAVAQQQAMGAQKGIVMDGRDIGTVVFPNAELKIFVSHRLFSDERCIPQYSSTVPCTVCDQIEGTPRRLFWGNCSAKG